MESANRNRTVRCNICGKFMLSKNLKRHGKTHKDILTMTEQEVREELRVRSAVKMEREGRRQRVVEIAHQENISIEHCSDIVQLTTPYALDFESLEEEMLHDNQNYLHKLELGNHVASIIDKGTVREESLTKGRKDDLDMYRKQRPRIDIQTVQLRPWQLNLMTLISTPSDREVFWI